MDGGVEGGGVVKLSIVKLIKRSLKSVLKDCPVYEESLRTFLNLRR